MSISISSLFNLVELLGVVKTTDYKPTTLLQKIDNTLTDVKPGDEVVYMVNIDNYLLLHKVSKPIYKVFRKDDEGRCYVSAGEQFFKSEILGIRTNNKFYKNSALYKIIYTRNIKTSNYYYTVK